MSETMEIKKTPLNEVHRAAGAKMVPFGGWDMPLQYGPQLEEHRFTRTHAGLFDVSHMGQVSVTGPGAAALVNYLITRDVSKLKDGEQAYAALVNEQGGLVDDLIAARITAEKWIIVVNAATREGDVALMREAAKQSSITGAELEDVSDQYAMIALQGPKWKDVAKQVLPGGEWETMKPFRITSVNWNASEVIVSSTGYTGERGVELLCPPDTAPQLWQALVAAGARPIGLAARDSLRLEMGYHLSGQDFTSLDNPFEANLNWVVDLEKGNFWGGEALRKLHAGGAKRKLTGLLPEGKRIPRHGAKIMDGDKVSGEVTSGGFSPMLDRPVAMGYVAIEKSKPGEIVEIDLGSTRIKATVVKPPFYKKEKGAG